MTKSKRWNDLDQQTLAQSQGPDSQSLSCISTVSQLPTRTQIICPQQCPKPKPGPASCMGEFRHFLVLMWKHMIVRLRKFIVTPIELISPCILFIILFLAKPFLFDIDLSGVSEGGEKRMLFRTHEVPMKNIMPPQLVLYTPAAFLTGELMDRAGWRMGLERLTSFPDVASRGYYGIRDDNLLNIYNIVKTMTDDSAIVIFEDLDEEEDFPERLKYTIRMKKDFPSEDDESNNHLQGAIYEPLLRLQWAIDSSFLSLHYQKQDERRSSANFPTVALSAIPLSDKRQKLLMSLVCFVLKGICMMSLLLPFIFLLTKLIAERTSGVLELLRQVGVSYRVWACSHSCNMILTGLCFSICGTIVCKITSSPFLPNSDMILLFLFFELYFHSIMSYAFLCSYLSSSGDYATTLAVVVYVLSYVPSRLLEEVKLSKYIRPLTGLLPHVPLEWFWLEVEALEHKGTGLGFKDVLKSHSKYSMSVLLAYLMMMVQCIFFLCFAGYLNALFPGKYGTSKPWNYCFKKRDDVAPAALQETREESRKRDPRYFEDSQLTDVGVNIDHVTKIFGKKIILSNVSFYIYRGEITVLLGHNGAGKTTLMSIITGMLPPTTGTVYVNGLDISKEQTKVQTVIGMCPQHNLFFSDLTVIEHVRLFAMLKGESRKEAKSSSKILLGKLGLLEKKNYRTDQLSGGMKRRVQLACALAGGSNVLILDEPTSGLDVETRRELWNLLLSLRGERTVLLSTHFMEEADALGDRVAALHSGRLQCHASPMYLKKNMGTGYRLSLTTSKLPQVANITALVTSVIPTATLKESGFNNVSYNLPSQETDKFPQLFSKLESKRSKLEIMSIGVGVSSLEEVFLRLCSNVDTEFTEEMVDTEASEPQYSKIKGCVLYMRQMCVLLRRQIRFLIYRKYSFLALEVLIPAAILAFWAYTLSEETEDKSETKKLSAMNLDAYDDDLKKTVLLRVNTKEEMAAVTQIARRYSNLEFQLTHDVGESFFRASKMDRKGDHTNLKKYFMGLELSDTNAKVMYSKLVRHSAPIALNFLSNVLAARYIPRADGRTITTNYRPLDDNLLVQFQNDINLNLPKSLMNCYFWISLLIIVVMATLINSVALPTTDREAGTRHIHMMAGCPPLVHWLTTFLTHAVLYTIVLLLPATLVSLLDAEETFDSKVYMGYLLLVLVLGSMAFLTLCYLSSFSFTRRGSGILLTHLIILFGVLPGTVLFMTHLSQFKLKDMFKIPFTILYYIFPGATLTVAALKTANVARLNAYCNKNLEKCRQILVTIFQILPANAETRGFDAEKCCLYHKGMACTLCINEFAPGKELIIMAIQTVVFFILVILTQYGIFNGMRDGFCNMGYRKKAKCFCDKFVQEETAYVSQQLKLPLHELRKGPDALLLHDVHKNYVSLCKGNCNAVKGISFSVKKGECFGLLGVNGAGKSTTFSMISGNEVPTRGTIYANGYFLKCPRSSKYLTSLGYCPQFFGLDEFLTGHDNLATLLALNGLHSRDILKETKSWIEVVGLKKYRNVLVQNYSGGCMRRLATAAALSSGASVTLLDEPTAGVDVSARRRVWLAMRKGLRQNRSIIITSHSMDEMEALCNRITIMTAGELGALGSAPELRANYAAGYALSIKLKSAGDTEGVQKLKEAISEKFNCTLKDDHITMLHYHINETMEYSEIFASLRQLKKKFSDTIEDYSVTETTLEEVFLSFAQPKPGEGPDDGSGKRKKKKK